MRGRLFFSGLLLFLDSGIVGYSLKYGFINSRLIIIVTMAPTSQDYLDEKLEFAADDFEEDELSLSVDRWKLIIADDDHEVHAITKTILGDYQYGNRGLHLISAYTGVETRQLIDEHPDTALILLDVVMENDTAGLDTVQYIRDVLCNDLVQIILRTGQPGQAPEHQVILKYGINDYKSKVELTAQKLNTAVTTSLRAYQIADSVAKLNRDLQQELEVRRKVEAELKKELMQREKAEEIAQAAKKAKALVLANMSHEFRTPLLGIQGFAELGFSRIAKGTLTWEQASDFFLRIKKSGHDLSKVLNTLLDISKLESGAASYDKETSDLRIVVQEAVKEFEKGVKEKGLILSVNFPEDSNPFAYFDKTLIGQVVRNLISNAIKFSQEGGHIAILYQDHTENSDRNNMVELSVVNRGVPIPQDELEIVFDAFVQSSKTDNFSLGQGLGLSICREIIEAHDGKIWAENGTDGETILRFVLPTQKP